ncbi:MAG: hypothetical protein C0418_00775 [Coriobacteriaceae bacterium]|nr:hypothetical protein [Coriobacteriaceae bacterium]
MEFREVIEMRHSCREFRPDPVPREVLDRLVHAAAMAPSAMNSQPAHLHIATGEVRDRVTAIMAQTTHHLQEYVELLPEDHLEAAARFFGTLGDAPVVVAMSVPETTDELERINEMIAAGCATQNILLSATDEGLAACNITFGFWVRDQLAEAFEVGAEREIVGLIVLGYSSAEPESPPHRSDIAEYVG